MYRQEGMDVAPTVCPTGWESVPEGALDVLRRYRTCEFSTIGRNGSPATHPVTAVLLEDGRFALSTSIGLPQKAFNIRRDERVSMLFSESTGSDVTTGAVVLVQGTATAPEVIHRDVLSDPDLAAAFRLVFARQPAGAAFKRFPIKQVLWPYYLRILIHVTPTRMRWWPNGEATREPEELEVRRGA